MSRPTILAVAGLTLGGVGCVEAPDLGEQSRAVVAANKVSLNKVSLNKVSLNKVSLNAVGIGGAAAVAEELLVPTADLARPIYDVLTTVTATPR